MKDEALKKEVLKELENKKITKKEAKEKLENFYKNLDLTDVIESEKEETYTFLNKEYKIKRINFFKGDIDNSKNASDFVKLIINKRKIPIYFKNRKIKKIKKICHQNNLVAGTFSQEDRFYAKKNNGIFENKHGKTILGKKAVFSFKKDEIIQKKSKVEIKKESEIYKSKLIKYVNDTFLKECEDSYKTYILNILNNNILRNIDKNGRIKDFIFKPKEFEIFKGYKNYDLYGDNLGAILKKNKDFNLVIASDTEFINIVGSNNKEECMLLSTQFAFYWQRHIYTFTFIVNKPYTAKLSINTFIQHILKFIDSQLFKINVRDNKTNKRLNITIMHHFGRADLQHYKEFYSLFYKGIALSIQGGIDSIRPIRTNIRYQNRGDREDLTYNVNINFRDTMGYCAGEKTLARQSSEQFFKKLEVDKDIDKSNMLNYLTTHTKDFLEYGDMDAIATLELGYKLWGFNCKYPFTIGQYAVNCFIDNEMEGIFGTAIENEKEIFKFLYNGIYKNDVVSSEDENGKINNKDVYTHTNISITNLLKYYTDSYHGGLNQCYTKGFFKDLTLDYDLVSAYPTLMSCIPRVNMLLPFKEFINITPEEALEKLQDFKEFNLACAVVDFDFSKVDERYKNHSCIAQKKHNNLVFTTEGQNVVVSGAELYRALDIGAITKVEKLIIPHYVKDKVFKRFYKKTIKLRNHFKKVFGKKSVQQEIIKMINNTPYGKTAQGLSKSKISSYINKIKTSDNMPSCDLTNPIYATAITSLVRCYLNDVIALIEEKGYTTHSVTTDGFICNVTSIDTLDKFTQEDGLLKEFTNKILEIGKDIQNDNNLKSLWEIKHTNEAFFNITTRGNFACNSEGVLACAGAKVLKKLSNRDKILHYLLKYEGKCQDKFLKLTTLSKMLIENEILSGVYIYKDNFFIEYDGKNIPLLNSVELTEVFIKNKKYEVLNFKSRQPKNIKEYLQFKSLLRKYKNATYTKEKFYKLIQEFNSLNTQESLPAGIIIRKPKNTEYLEVKNFLTNLITKNLNNKIIKFFKTYTRQEIIEFLNINFLEFNNKKLTKNVFEHIQKEIKKLIEAKKEIKKLEADYIELKILEHIKSKK